MAELWLIRHAQASFGAADYDKLSDLGHAQSRELGLALTALGMKPDAVFIGAQRRHRETWEGINSALGFDTDPGILPGFNEFDFGGLLNARYRGKERPKLLHTDRRGEITDPPEPYADFAARVRNAREQAVAGDAEQVIVVTSGGAIGQTVSEVMGAPADAMIRLQLQIKNCSVSRIIITPRGSHLSTFNETPHITATNIAQMLTYS